ncbi:phospho-sugar mutase [Cryptosporangium aurantiacum]|uniref:Phosphomannomutase n=1 Tax=Cryptosporangium aurantiacum TaxID=134849 RepID=A0A1M7RGL3_9ACTN|nr:phospho-sugar mutase [Cryptosporangium aurantiacum]SHN45423.1 phosphomannomutase [Cryptosporangium aurantiacum]
MTETSGWTGHEVAALRHRTETWIADDPDPVTRAELQAVLAGLPGSLNDLADRFAGPLTFGTAGLRGPVRAGPNGMNRAVVRAAAAGLCAYLDDRQADGPVVIGYDARRGSADFAAETAAVVTGAGRAALVLPRPLPTPVLAYAVRRLDAAAGVMVTASHNPPGDNGYKVYLSDGAQIVPPADKEIEERIRAVEQLAAVPLGTAAQQVEELLVDEYVAATVQAVLGADPAADARRAALAVAYTPLHGVGREVLERAFAAAGFAPPSVVASQSEPDPAFPTVAFPNPEEPGAVDELVALATSIGADIAIANDPDADRCAVAVPSPSGWRLLHGDEVGALLADSLLRHGVRGTFATTIVSSSLLSTLAPARGARAAETLTGFKWIVRAADDLAFGYEEALGYAVAPGVVRDKDGIGAALAIADLAAELKARGRTLTDRLDELAVEFGLHATSQLSVRVDDLREIADMMARIRSATPTTLLGRAITEVHDRLPDADVLTLRAPGVRVVVRPSGTEPKLKAYLEVVEPVSRGVNTARGAAAEHLAALRAEVAAALGV